jgi:multidrug resistance efflux pump
LFFSNFEFVSDFEFRVSNFLKRNRRGQPLFQFDRRPYEYQVRQLEAQLVQAHQNVRVLEAELDSAKQSVTQARSQLAFARDQQQRADILAKKGAGPVEDAQKWTAQAQVAEATVQAALANVEVARLKYESEIDGVNTAVATVQAELDQARFYLGNTTMGRRRTGGSSTSRCVRAWLPRRAVERRAFES